VRDVFHRLSRPHPSIGLSDQFGVRSLSQVARAFATVLSHVPARDRYTASPSSAGLLRPDLSLPAYAGLVPNDGIAPIFNLFDRTGGGNGFRSTVTRDTCRDFRGGRLSYDEHDGTDLVCPPGTPLVVAAPGVLVATRESFLRGGLTACVDHGHGVVTQYTHLSRLVAEIGQPLRRGEVVAMSGTAGFDMVSGFPWVPPHVHFMVWVRGRPIDPYRADGEAVRAGLWLHGNAPRTSAALSDDAPPPSLEALAVDHAALEHMIDRCRSPAIRAELARAPSAAARVAICEDSLHHDRPDWREESPDVLRPPGDPLAVRLTLPLPPSEYRGARPADAPWTRP
jgi:hypothetical protein